MALPYRTLPGDADHLIADDHAVVERQFQHLEAGRGDRRALVDQVPFELALHATAEEKVVYPAMKDAGLVDETQEARDEHQDMKEQLAVLDRTEPGEPEFEEALAALIADVRHHVPEEETELLPGLRERVGDARMAELGEEFLRAKRTAPTHAHPSAPSSGIGHKLADLGALVVDKVRDRASGRRERLATDPSGLLDPQAQALMDAYSSLDPMPPEILTPEEARRVPGPDAGVRKALEDAGRSTEPEPVGSVEDVQVAGADGDITVRVYRPEGAGPHPVVMWIHGGGWVLFDLDTYDASCRGLCVKTGAVVVSPDYRRAPEHVFPAAHEDVLAVWRWLREHAAELGGDPTRMAIGGESVGGTMAATTSWSLAQAGERVPVAQVLAYPLTTAEPYGESMDDSADARPLVRPLLTWMAMHAFRGVEERASDPRVDLLSLPAEQLAAMPPTLVVNAQRDVLRSQGEEFARRLSAAGVAATQQTYLGVMHEFFGASAVIDKAEQAQQLAAEHLRAAFVTARS